MPRIDLPGTCLNVIDIGDGAPILFVHGFPLDHSMWRFQLDELPRHGFRCIAPDLRGFGKSGVTEGTVTLEQFADDLAALLDAMQVTEPVFYCGLSMGGLIAWHFVQRHVSRLKALILCDTRAAADTAEVAANRLKLANDVVLQGPELVANAMLPRLFSAATAKTAPELVEETRRVILATNPIGIAAAARGMAQRADARPLLPSVAVPSLLIVGEHDVITPPAEMHEVTNALPDARIHVIPTAGHMAPLENSVLVNQAIRDFVS